ncbi:MAG: flavin reductase family protein [Pirellulales bacterium]
MAGFNETINQVFGLLDREVWIVTSAFAGDRGGLLATWVSQASIDPDDPLVVIALAVNHHTKDLVDRGGAFGLHLIAREQIDLAWRFALGSGRDRDKLAGVDQSPQMTGAPILADCLAWLDCQVIDRHEAADRKLFWGRVLGGGVQRGGTPLRERELLASASAEQSQALKRDLQSDIELQRPLITAWKANRTA